MKESTEGANGAAPLKASLAKLPKHLAHLNTPDGRTLDAITGSELFRLCARLGVPGARPDAGRAELAACYWRHLEGIADAAAHAAVESYLRASR